MTEPRTTCLEIQMLATTILDRESGPDAADVVRAHLASCAACRSAVATMQKAYDDLNQLSYGAAALDLWPAIEARLQRNARHQGVLWGLAAFTLFWRSVQLFWDLPLVILQPVIPLVAVIATLRWLVRNPLAIASSLPELEQKGA